MASSNKHWPSLFKSKPSSCNQQWQNDVISSANCHRASAAGVEERTPEPKPRWNPKPEQIRILETIFNSGMVNPPRDEIRKIRARLQEFGQVGDANVFYWFQNRKSRSKHKQRHLQATAKAAAAAAAAAATPPAVVTNFITSSSSSSSSEKSSPNSIELNKGFSVFSAPNEFPGESFFYPAGPGSGSGSGPGFAPAPTQQGFYFPELSIGSDLTVGNSSGILSAEFLGLNGHNPNPTTTKGFGDDKFINLHPQLGFANDNNHVASLSSFCTTAATAPAAPTIATQSLLPPPPPTLPSTLHQFPGLGEAGVIMEPKATVYVNDVAFEVTPGLINVREVFGDDVVLINYSSGQPMITNEWGVTIHPLLSGAFYYLARTSSSTPSPHDNNVIELD